MNGLEGEKLYFSWILGDMRDVNKLVLVIQKKNAREISP